MRFIKALYFLVFVSVISSVIMLDAIAKNENGREYYTYLLAGYDYTYENTDVISVVSYSTRDNTLSLLQIPRDTYFDHGYGQRKINQLYPHLLAHGISRDDAMLRLTEAISDAFGIDIDGYIGLTGASFTKLIDSLGGIDVCLEEDLILLDGNGNAVKKYNAGNNRLSGADALTIARYRKGYPDGDLGRLSMQRLIIKGITDRLRAGVSYLDAMNIVAVMKDSVTSITPTEALGFLLKNAEALPDTRINIHRLPGKPVINKGISYYVTDAAKSDGILDLYFQRSQRGIDKNGILTIPSGI